MATPPPIWLRGKLDELLGSAPASKLPPLRELALRWGTSAASVQRLVREAVEQGRLESRMGSGVWPAGARTPAFLEAPAKMDAERLSDRIREGILHGLYPGEIALPSPKQEALRHGLHPSTVRKAYSILEGRRLVERRGRSWVVAHPSLPGPRRHRVVLCVGAAGPDGGLRMDSDREWDFWRDVQSELARCGLVPRLVPIGTSLPAFDEPVFGAIFSNLHLPEGGPVLEALHLRRIPTAVWSTTEELLPGPRFAGMAGFRFHDLAFGREAGAIMGRFASESGHRRVAWISPFHGSSWSRHRLEGLRHGLGNDVELVEATHGWISEWDEYVRLAWSPETLSRFRLDGIEAPDPDKLRRPLVDALVQERCLAILEPALDSALRSGATLWVACSDLAASWCLSWLRRRGIEVPRDLSLAGFDDARDATRLDLTSLRFPIQEMVRAMVRQILSGLREKGGIVRYAGEVVERGSTRPRTLLGGGGR